MWEYFDLFDTSATTSNYLINNTSDPTGNSLGGYYIYLNSSPSIYPKEEKPKEEYFDPKNLAW